MAARFQFLVSCPGCSGRWVDFLDEMTRSAVEVTPRTFARHADYHGIARELGYPFGSPRVTLLTDPHVAFCRGRFGDQPAYFFVWSAMEYIFTPGGRASREGCGRGAKSTLAQLRAERSGGWSMRLRAGGESYAVPVPKTDVLRALKGAPSSARVEVERIMGSSPACPGPGEIAFRRHLILGRGARGLRAPPGWHVLDDGVDGEGNRAVGLVRGDKRSHTHLVEQLPDGSWRYRCFPPTGWEPVANHEPLAGPEEGIRRARQTERELAGRLPPFPAFGRGGRRAWGRLKGGNQTVPVSALGPGPFEVRIASAPNPDLMHGQGTGTGYWGGAGPLKARWVKARTIPEAVMVARTFIDRAGLGAGNWTGGQIRRAGTDEVVATVSYNGRVWLPDSVETEDWAVEVV